MKYLNCNEKLFFNKKFKRFLSLNLTLKGKSRFWFNKKKEFFNAKKYFYYKKLNHTI